MNKMQDYPSHLRITNYYKDDFTEISPLKAEAKIWNILDEFGLESLTERETGRPPDKHTHLTNRTFIEVAKCVVTLKTLTDIS